MSIHFITVLGTSLYSDCVYAMEGTEFAYNTPFAQMATLNYIVSVCGKCDRITVFVTEKAEEKNWHTREYTENERQILKNRKIELKPDQLKIGLEQMMEEEFPDTIIESVRIREGQNKEKIDEIFELMYDAILPEETIYFDFTHGLRNIPMQALTVIHYAKVLKNIQVGGMYYGAFELGEKKEDGLIHVNLLDMSACSAILDWTNAAESFIKGGSSNQIGKLYRERVRPGREERYNTKTLERLCDLTNCLNTSRGKAGKNGRSSIQKAYEYFKLNYIEMQKNMNLISEKPLLRLFDKIEEDVRIFDRKCCLYRGDKKIYLENTATGMAAVEWAIRKSLTQQGFTALEETIKTYLCETYDIPAEEELTRDMIVGSTVKFLANRYNIAVSEQKKAAKEEPTQPGDEWSLINAEKLREGRREELYANKVFQKLPVSEREFCLKKVDELLANIRVDLANLTLDASRYRNTLNHFGFQKDEIDYRRFQNKLKDLYRDLRKIMEEEHVVWE